MFWKLLLAAAVIAVAYYRWTRRRLYKLATEIPPLPDNYPIIGITFMFLGSNEDRMKQFQNVGRSTNKHGGPLHGWLGPRLFVCLSDPESIEVVSKSCLDKDEFTMRFTRNVVGNGSIFAPVKIWHPRRKINAPFFNLKNLNKIVPIFDNQSSVMSNRLRAEIGRDFSMWKYATTFTFDSVCESAVNVNVNSQKTQGHLLLQTIDVCTNLAAKRITQPWLHPNYIYEKTPDHKDFEYNMKRGNAFIDEIIQKKRDELKENYNTSRSEWSSYLDIMIESSESLLGKGYSDLELREEIMVMLIAGNDTSAVAMCYTAVLLCRYPDVQAKVHQELQEVFGDSDRPVTAEDLPRLKYLEAVIKESMRLYPPVPVVVREVHKDVVLPSGVTLVDGTSILINIWGTHRNPAYWGEDVEQFRPERFLEGPLKHPVQYVPFSYSIRSCIGSTYAMMSAKTALANVLRHYRFLPPSCASAEDLKRPIPVKFDIMMKATDGFIVRIEENTL